jgi:hypothetical protein
MEKLKLDKSAIKYIIFAKNSINELSMYGKFEMKQGDLYALIDTLNNLPSHKYNNIKFYGFEFKYFQNNTESIINDILN